MTAASGGPRMALNNKKVKQFSTRSRSKSNASFKGLNKLRKVSSHDGTYEMTNGVHNNATMKKSKSSDSLSRRRAISGLSMTALTRTKSNPGTTAPTTLSNSYGGLKPMRRPSSKSVLELHDGDELYEEDSTTDEEVEYFTDEEENYVGRQGKAQDEEDSAPRSVDKPVSYVAPAPVDDSFSRQSSMKTLTNQPSYKPPSSLTNKSSIGSDNDLISNNSVNNTGNYKNIENGDIIHDPNHMDECVQGLEKRGQLLQSNESMNEEQPTEGMEGEEVTAVQVHREQNREDRDDGDDKEAEEGGEGEGEGEGEDANQYYFQGQPGSNEHRQSNASKEQYVPSMILSQSTGIERHFAHPPSVQNSLGNRFSVQEDETGDYINEQAQGNRFQYINSDLASSLKSNETKDLVSNNNPKNDFSTSISSLSNHLQRPTTVGSAVRVNPLLNRRTSQNSLLRSTAKSRTPFLAETTSSTATHLTNRTDTSSNFNNFSQFLQSDNGGAESRTQQKLWLQRENSILDLSAQNPTTDSIFLASNIEVKREFERISREYTNVRRFCNPLNESLIRISSHNEIEIRKHRTSPSQTDELSSTVFGSYKDKKTFEDLHPQTSNRIVEIQRILAKIWNEESVDFNRDYNPTNNGDNDNNNIINGNKFQNSLNARHSRRGQNSMTNLQQHQRTINSLQPTTRAVHRRMENALNQQRL